MKKIYSDILAWQNNILMKGVLLIIILLLPCFVNAQNCFTRIDPKTGKTTKSGVTELTGDSTIRSSKLVFVKADPELSLSLSFISTMLTDKADVSKMNVLVEFINGEIKVYSPKAGSTALKMPDGTGIVFECSITTAGLNYFHDNRVAQIIVKFNDADNSNINIPVSELKAREIIQSIACLSNLR